MADNTNNLEESTTTMVKRENDEAGDQDTPNKKLKTEDETEKDTPSAAAAASEGGGDQQEAESQGLIPAGSVGVTKIEENDVLSGRGGGTNLHQGNRQFRDLINLYRRDYLKARKNDKPAISRSIVNSIREKTGRFLKKVEKSGLWFEIGDDAAREKTSQALRQRAPEMRKLLLDHELEGARAQQQMMMMPGGMPGMPGMPPGGMPMMMNMPGMPPGGMPMMMTMMPNGMFNPMMQMGMPPMGYNGMPPQGGPGGGPPQQQQQQHMMMGVMPGQPGDVQGMGGPPQQQQQHGNNPDGTDGNASIAPTNPNADNGGGEQGGLVADNNNANHPAMPQMQMHNPMNHGGIMDINQVPPNMGVPGPESPAPVGTTI